MASRDIHIPADIGEVSNLGTCSIIAWTFPLWHFQFAVILITENDYSFMV
jgi:hypothetical protein